MNVKEKSSMKLMLTLSFCLLCLACKNKNSVSSEPVTFDIEYIFVNTGDSNINAIEIVSLTYYPEVDRSRYRKKNFPRPGTNDTLSTTAQNPGYLDCHTQMGLLINKEWEPDKKFWRYFTFDKDTISSINERVTTFVWPADTARAVELPFRQPF